MDSDGENSYPQRTTKRKKVGSPEKGRGSLFDINWLQRDQSVVDKIGELCKTVKALKELCKAHPCTKNEIKTKVDETWIKVNRLRLSELYPEKPKTNEISTQTEKLMEEEAQTGITTTKRRNCGVNVATQTTGKGDEEKERALEEEEAQRIKSEMRETTDVTRVLELIDKFWPNQVYYSTQVQVGNPLLIANADLGIYCTDPGMEKGIEKQFKDRFPELLETLSTNQVSVNSVKITTHFSGACGQSTRTRHIFRVTSSDTVNEMNKMQLFLEGIKKLRDQMIIEGRKNVSIPVPDGMCYQGVRKALEYVFCETDLMVTLHIPKANAGTKSKSLSTGVTPKTKEKKRTDTSIVVVKAQGKEYADLLRSVKREVSQGNTEVKSVRRSREGDLLLIVDGGQEEATKMGNLIKATIPESQVLTKGGEKTKTLHIFNIDGVTTKEEVVQTIEQVLEETGKVTVKSLRPAYGGNQNATIQTSEKIADKLLYIGKVKIGWVRCPIKERITPTRCFKCQEFGHVAKECKGPERKNCCLKCGKSDHRVKECVSNTEYCLTCKTSGHRVDNMLCPEYKKLVQKQRDQNKNAGRNKKQQ